MTHDSRSHWQTVYAARDPEEQSWYQANPEHSLALLELAGAEPGTRILDVGGGASRLVDCLLDRGHPAVGVLDIAETALERAKARLGERASEVEWFVADVTRWDPPHPWDVWHDRAVFHFLVTAESRAGYRRALTRAIPPGGHAIIAAFGPRGPTRCSGLVVRRYSASQLLTALGEGWRLIESRVELHRTPGDVVQEFEYGLFERG